MIGVSQMDDLSGVERESLLRNDLRPAIKPFKGNKLFLRFATQGDTHTRLIKLKLTLNQVFTLKCDDARYGDAKGRPHNVNVNTLQ